MRVIVDAFRPNRSQKRAFKKHQNMTTTILPVAFHEEHYALYAAYQRARHSDNTKQDESTEQAVDVEQYQNFLCQTNVESVLVEFREDNLLKMVSVIDIVSDGISAVYTFYAAGDYMAVEGSAAQRPSYGTYNVLWQVEWTKSLGLPYLYLGYWIKDSKKMAYKQNYQPQEKFINGDWVK